ncbi:type II toxin-antitoxin system VapC family toxin [Nitrospira sp. M1]
MNILIDTGVLIDTALNRTPHADASVGLLEALEGGVSTGFVSWHTLSNFFYLVAPIKGAPETRVYLEELTRFVQVAPTTTESLRYACQLPMKDFENVMQVLRRLQEEPRVSQHETFVIIRIYPLKRSRQNNLFKN